MKKIVVLFLILSSLTISKMYSQAGWNILGPEGSVMSGKSYYLQVIKNKYHLTYKEKNYGINLGWKKGDSPNIVFEKKDGGKINCGDKIAIKISNKGYLKYKSRKYGINLVWSDVPSYEFELRTLTNNIGEPILCNTEIGIANNVEKDFMVYCERCCFDVVNLGWFKDCPGGTRLPGNLNNYRDFVDFAWKHKEKLLLLL